MRLPTSQFWALGTTAIEAVRTWRPEQTAGVIRPRRPLTPAAYQGKGGTGKGKQGGGGVAILELCGLLERRQSALGEYLGGTDLSMFSQGFDYAMRDPSVGTILILVDSPGGDACGTLEVAEQIFQARDQKRIIAACEGLNCSAAYWISSAASVLVAAPSCDLGSIGVYSLHLSFAGALANEGIKATLIREPPLKSAGNEFEDLDGEALQEYQRQTRVWYSDFLSAVAKHCGILPSQVASNFGRGMTMRADEALSVGMCDKLATITDVVRHVILGSNLPSRGASMEQLRAAQYVRELDSIAMRRNHGDSSRCKRKLLA